METISVKSSSLKFDEQYQIRVDIPSCDEYTEILKGAASWPFPPLVCFQSGRKFVILEGFTRGSAAKHAEWTNDIPITVVDQQTAWDIVLATNSQHGYRRTSNDKRAAVLKAYALRPNDMARALAERCNVSTTFVYRMINSIRQGQDADQLEAALEPDRREVCLVCQQNAWIECEEGWRCQCGALEPQEETQQEPHQATPAVTSTAVAAAPRTKTKAAPSSPAARAHAQAVNTRLVELTAIAKDVGGIIRRMNDMRLLDPETQAAWTVIKTTVLAAKRAANGRT